MPSNCIETPLPPERINAQVSGPSDRPWLQLRRRLGIGEVGPGQVGPMYDLLREKWARGKLSSTDIHELAAASGEDNDRRLHKVRKIGATRDSKTRVNLFKNRLPVVQKHPSLDPNQKHPSLDPNLLYRSILLSALVTCEQQFNWFCGFELATVN